FLAGLGERVNVNRAPVRGSFARNMNTLARAASGRWLCLLNNDTVLQPRWLDELLLLAQQQPRAAVLGNLHRFPHNRAIHHAGIVFDESKSPRLLYQGLPDTPAARVCRPMQCVNAACWLVPADSYHRLGGLDESYWNGYEDMDFCLRARAAGHEVWYCGSSQIEHHGQASPGRMSQEDANRRLFYSRWRDHIVADLDHFVLGDGVPWPRRSRSYRFWHGVWRSRLMSPLRNAFLRTSLGVSLRRRLLAGTNNDVIH
ncbi:MAG: glycosyltransferase, partial [Gemmataceae bacterium]